MVLEYSPVLRHSLHLLASRHCHQVACPIACLSSFTPATFNFNGQECPRTVLMVYSHSKDMYLSGLNIFAVIREYIFFCNEAKA